LAWAHFADNPLGGETVAVVPTAPALGMAAVDNGKHAAGGEEQSDFGPVVRPSPAKPVSLPVAKTVTIIDGSSGQHQGVVGTSARPQVDRQLLEPTPQGARSGPDGARAYARYASPPDLPANRKEAPRIAVIVGGLGISDSGTVNALAKLPTPETFAFAP
jgi:hypothetical protein